MKRDYSNLLKENYKLTDEKVIMIDDSKPHIKSFYLPQATIELLDDLTERLSLEFADKFSMDSFKLSASKVIQLLISNASTKTIDEILSK